MPENPSKQILVVDDEPDVLTVIIARLKAAGHQVTSAVNGQDALEKIKKNIPDLIVSDVLMPVMDGFKLYKELKNNKVTADIPVLILTARGKMEDSFKVMGVDEFIAKPFESDDFIRKVNVLLNRSAATPQVKAGTKVLLAGTDNSAVENMSVQLKKAGCHTEMAFSGPDIISKSVLFQPKIIVLEVQMDGMLSREIIKVLRQMPGLDKVPILVYSFYDVASLGSEDIRQKALSVDSSTQDCLDAGATEYIGRFNENTFLKSFSPYLNNP